MGAAVIDLGVLEPPDKHRTVPPKHRTVPPKHRTVPPGPAQPGQMRPRVRAWWGRQRVRWVRQRPVVGPSLLVALVLLLVAGAAAPEQPRLVRLWTLPGPSAYELVVAGDTGWATHQSAAGWTLSAYALATGERRWVTELAGPDGWASLAVAGDMPLAITPGPDRVERVTAYDRATGAPVWSHIGYLRGIAAGGRVVLAQLPPDSWPRDDGTVPGDGIHPYQLVVVDVDTGAVSWTRRLGAGEILLDNGPAAALGQHLTHLVSWRSDGRLTAYDLATGAVAATTEAARRSRLLGRSGSGIRVGTGWLSLADANEWSQAYLDGTDQVVIVPGADELTGYDAETLAVRWRVSLVGRLWAVPCAAMVCAFTSPNGELQGIDRSTGEVRWVLPCGTGLDRAGPCLLMPTTAPVAATVLVSRQLLVGAERVDSILAVDPVTGELVGELTPWHLIGGTGTGRGWLVARPEPAGSGAPQGNPPAGQGLRGALGGAGQTHPAAGVARQHWLAWWRPGPDGFHVLGVVDASRCDLAVVANGPTAAEGSHLVCHDAHPSTTVWQVR